MGKLLETIMGGLLATALVFADLLQLTYPFSLSFWLYEAGLPTLLVLVMVGAFYVFVISVIGVLIRHLLKR